MPTKQAQTLKFRVSVNGPGSTFTSQLVVPPKDSQIQIFNRVLGVGLYKIHLYYQLIAHITRRGNRIEKRQLVVIVGRELQRWEKKTTVPRRRFRTLTVSLEECVIVEIKAGFFVK